MRLLSLTVRNYRVHKDLTLHFDPSRNLIGGANESGKSTLAEAAHRALFLRAKTGGAILEKMVSTIHNGDPEVVLKFEAEGITWEVEKRFSSTRGSTRLTGTGGITLKDDDADAKLSELLKTESGGRANATKLEASWAHLWVWQGKSGEDPASHASNHNDTLVQRLQKDGISAVMQSANDQRVRERVAAAYEELFTATGKPKAGSKPELAKTRLAEAEEILLRSRETAERLEAAVTEHARAEREIAEIEAVLPGLRTRRAETDEKLTRVNELRREEETRLRAMQASASHRQQISANDAKIRTLLEESAAARLRLTPAEEVQARLISQEQIARQHEQAAEEAHRQATGETRLARARHELSAARVTAIEKAAHHSRLSLRSNEAAGVSTEIAGIREALGKLPAITAKDLVNLRKLDRDAIQATTTLEAMAAGVKLIHSNSAVTLEGRALAMGESRILTDAGELKIGDGTLLRIRPGGGSSLSESRARATEARAALRATLDRHTLRDLEEATAVLEQRQTLEQQLTQSQTRWMVLDGKTIANDLATAYTDLQAALAEVGRRTEALAADALSPAPNTLEIARKQTAEQREALASAEGTEHAVRTETIRLRSAWQTTADALQAHRDKILGLQQSLRDFETRIEVLEQTHGDTSTRRTALQDAIKLEDDASAQLATTRKALSDLDPDTLASDFDRYKLSIIRRETALGDAKSRRDSARGRLTHDGVNDPHAEFSHALARRDAALEAHASELRRANSIAKLHQLFSSSREAINRNLVQPLADRISGYLRCLFGPGAEVQVNLSDTGIQGLDLIRAGDPSFGFGTLSGGAKEQVAAATRLAMAEILATDHDGCLPVIFDDAFAYSDPDRIVALQRMLDLAARRGLQVIVLTCAANDYSSLGAVETRIS